MKHLISFKLFEAKDKSRYRKELVGIVVDYEDIDQYEIPEEIKIMMKDWEVIFKSPYSNSFYSSTDVSWDRKPDGCFRVSDHWNFYANDKMHCQTDSKVLNTSHVSIGQYNKKLGIYKILKSVHSIPFLNKLKNAEAKREYMQRPDIIEKKKELKQVIEDKKVLVELNFKGKIYKGILRKYTGSEIKIEDENGNLAYGNNYLNGHKRRDVGTYTINLFDTEGNPIKNLYLDNEL